MIDFADFCDFTHIVMPVGAKFFVLFTCFVGDGAGLVYITVKVLTLTRWAKAPWTLATLLHAMSRQQSQDRWRV